MSPSRPKTPSCGPAVLEVTIDGSSGVTPKALSKSQYTPITFTAAGNVRTTDGSQPPALKEVLLDAKNSAVNVKGYPDLHQRQTAGA